jgi:periplasmic divalent cation tolerance protein
MGYSIIITTAACEESAKKIAEVLVEKRLAACVQMFPVKSVYVWQGKVCKESEITLHIKSKASLFGMVSEAIKAHHSYQVPEIIQIPIADGSADYLKWIDEMCP